MRILKHHRKQRSKSRREKKNTCAIYARVSSHKQSKRGDLQRQIEQLKNYVRENNLKLVKVYKDVGSGLNVNRKGLWRLLKDSKKGDFSVVLLNFKDRLTRFGYTYLERYLSEFGVKLFCVNKLDDKTPESELVEDLVAIVHSFSGKLYRMRRTEKEQNKKSGHL
jgi:putative resolvase